MQLFIGLGNPGIEYEGTRHNIGFRVIDKLIKNSNARDVSKASFYGKLYKTHNALFLQPTTYMNLSGKSVIAVKNFFKIDIKDIIVIHDDLDLPFGALRFKIGGGHGGHNGLKSIDSAISKEYIRVRMGIGKPEHKSQVSSFVLSNFSDDENSFIDKYINHSIDGITKIKDDPLEIIKSKYTLKSIDSIK